MKKIFLPLLLTIFLLTGCGGLKQQKIIVGIDDDFAPMGFRNEQGEIVGFDIDLAKELGNRMGVEMVFQPIDWENKKEEILSGHIDIIWNGLDITPERETFMIFSKPYMDDRQIILVKRNSDLEIYSEYDLEGKIVGTQAGSNSECYLRKNFNDLLVLKTYSKFKGAVDALKKDEIDLIVCDELVARYEMNSHPDQLKIINVKVGVITETGIGFRKEDTELRDRFQKIFDEMIKDGTAKAISEKWFGADLIKLKK
jgi:polar amino acid transport system substrate-binding protein